MISVLNKREIDAMYEQKIYAYNPEDLALGDTELEKRACLDRAHVVGCDLKNDCGILTGKVFVKPKEGRLGVDLGRYGSAEWKAHVANVVYQEDDNGKMTLVVIDRYLNRALKRPGPFTYKEWTDILSGKGSTQIETDFAHASLYDPEQNRAEQNKNGADCLAESVRKNLRNTHRTGLFREKFDRLEEGARR